MKIYKKRICILLLGIILVGAAGIVSINFYVKAVSKDRIVTADNAYSQSTDCILVLGAGIREDGTPTPMLEERLDMGIALYHSGAAPKLLMSGDHGRKDYDEVQTMKDYAIEKGVPSSDIFMDHAGFSTYESLYRARDIFQADKLIIVTQKYHLYRSLYIAGSLGIDSLGVSADTQRYGGQTYRELREILARNKDFLTSLYKPNPTYLGESIPVSGDGNITND